MEIHAIVHTPTLPIRDTHNVDSAETVEHADTQCIHSERERDTL